mgnify:CR=1 FL=1
MVDQESIKRIKNIEGHMKGIARMLDQDAYCIDVIKQIQAVQAALAKLNLKILDNHLHSCVTEAIQGSDPSERERVLEEIMDIYKTATR